MSYKVFEKKSSVTKKSSLVQSITLMKENLLTDLDHYTSFNILKFGRILEGWAYYHESDQSYSCVGIEVEIESQIKGLELSKEVGFYCLWKGKSSVYAPTSFEISYDSIGNACRFENGCGDHLEVTKVLFTVDEVQRVANSHQLL